MAGCVNLDVAGGHVRSYPWAWWHIPGPCPIPRVQDVVNTHPGLAFLKEASEFHSRYITTVSTSTAAAPGLPWAPEARAPGPP